MQIPTSSRLVLSESKKLRLVSMTAFYFAQGLPIGLYLTAVSAWVAKNGASASDVAFLVTTTYLPWSFKFFGAALMDRYTYLAMGRRRIWLIASQFLMFIGLLVAALASPGPGDISLLAYVGFAIFVGSAMQDVAVDGLAVDLLPEEEQGTASAFMFAGQSFGIAIGAALGGTLLSRYGSTVTFLSFVPLVGLTCLLAIIMRERTGEKILPWTAGQASPATSMVGSINWLAILKITFVSMIKRDSLFYLAATTVVRATGGIFVAFWPVYATTKANWSTQDYAAMVAVVGLIVSTSGMGLGSLLNAKLGPRRSCIFSAGLYIVLGGLLLVLPQMGLLWGGLIALYALTDSTSLLFTISGNPLRMRLSDKRVAATQFTIYNSLGNLPVPAGAYLLAWTTNHGGQTVTMSTVIGLAIVGMILVSLLRIGNVVDSVPEIGRTPRLD